MNTWPIQEAKAKFSELLETCLSEGPQLVTKRGTEAAVLVSVNEWRRLQQSAHASLKDLLLSNDARAALPLPPRGQGKHRTPKVLF